MADILIGQLLPFLPRSNPCGTASAAVKMITVLNALKMASIFTRCAFAIWIGGMTKSSSAFMPALQRIPPSKLFLRTWRLLHVNGKPMMGSSRMKDSLQLARKGRVTSPPGYRTPPAYRRVPAPTPGLWSGPESTSAWPSPPRWSCRMPPGSEGCA